MVVKKFSDIEIYQQAVELEQIGNDAVKTAQAENRRLGIPNVYSRNGKLYYELPNGEITTKNPFADIEKFKPNALPDNT